MLTGYPTRTVLRAVRPVSAWAAPFPVVAFAPAVTDGLAKTPRRGFEASLARVGGNNGFELCSTNAEPGRADARSQGLRATVSGAQQCQAPKDESFE